jgi:hypothetical protein
MALNLQAKCTRKVRFDYTNSSLDSVRAAAEAPRVRRPALIGQSRIRRISIATDPQLAQPTIV